MKVTTLIAFYYKVQVGKCNASTLGCLVYWQLVVGHKFGGHNHAKAARVIQDYNRNRHVACKYACLP
ncbi:hypothetical protein HK096_008914, partial [Nowakowskiella sp. JEL0078]